MGLSSFRLNIVLRAVAFACLCSLLLWSLFNTQWLATVFLCGTLAVLCVADLIWYVERTTRDLAGFLTFVNHSDFSTPLPSPGKGRVFVELQTAYETLAGTFRSLNRQKDANHRYLEAVVEHVAVALCCFDEAGMVRMSNAPARQLFNLPHLNSLRSFERVDERLPELLRQMPDGERTLFSVRAGDELLQLVLYATTFELLERRYKLVSFQNIRDELDRQEIDSWQKLTRVLTHEIMNSVTPIVSLSALIRESLIDESVGPPSFRELGPSEQNDMLRGITAIHTRSSGLVDFVQAYRTFARLPAPELAPVDVRTLLERVRMLVSGETESTGISVSVACSQSDLTVRTDAGQIEQVLINLMRNAIEALPGTRNPRIELHALRNARGQVLMQVIDNGPGIPSEHLDSIFVPFFTTKRSGTGVGLSVCRQLMHANRGFISVRSAPQGGTAFTLRFRDQ
jgi:two-component system, NtrC family, nitrogen regulation sensor histidine kinase NtrY